MTAIDRSSGFSLMEVLIAVAILGLALTAIFSSEAGAIKAAHRARKTGIATLLARCKMGEIEEEIMKEGPPAIDDAGHDACCVDGEVEGFRCEWEVKRVLLPDNLFDDMDDIDPMRMLAGDTPASDTDEATAEDPTAFFDPSGSGIPGGGAADLLMGGGGALAELALQFTYPVLKPAFEEQIRRATVRVNWSEGSATKHLELVQMLVAEQPMKLPGQDEAIGSGEMPGADGTGSGSGTQSGGNQ